MLRVCLFYILAQINTTVMNDRLSYEEKKELPDSVFGLPERREYPMPDAAHVRAAEAYFRYCPEELKSIKQLFNVHDVFIIHFHCYEGDIASPYWGVNPVKGRAVL